MNIAEKCQDHFKLMNRKKEQMKYLESVAVPDFGMRSNFYSGLLLISARKVTSRRKWKVRAVSRRVAMVEMKL